MGGYQPDSGRRSQGLPADGAAIAGEGQRPCEDDTTSSAISIPSSVPESCNSADNPSPPDYPFSAGTYSVRISFNGHGLLYFGSNYVTE